MLLGLTVVFGIYKGLSLIMLLFIGTVANVATSGNIVVPNSTNNTINDTVASADTGYGLLNSGDTIILGLIGLVVILKLFLPMISPYLPDKKKGKGKNYM